MTTRNRDGLEIATKAEVKDFLKVSETTLNYWIFTKRIPYLKIGRFVRFNMAEIRDWVEKQNFSQEVGQ